MLPQYLPINASLLRTILTVCAIIFCIPAGAFAKQHDMSNATIAERIKPVGAVNIADEQAQVQGVVQTTDVEGGVEEVATAVDGQAIYDQYCSICHATGLAGAPKIGDSTEWQSRTEQGMDVMLENVEKGYNAMPMKGTCMDCNEEQLKAAVEYMLPK